jgi:ribosomal protein S17E
LFSEQERTFFIARIPKNLDETFDEKFAEKFDVNF